jgi:lipopolysaccharide transport system permease protein
MSTATETRTQTLMLAPPEPEASALPEHAESIIVPPQGWQPINVRELWQFRELICFLIWRDVKVRYKQTLLGVAWTVLQPAMMMVVFTLFFSRAAGFKDDEVPYPVFVICGLLPWTFFSSGLPTALSGRSDSSRRYIFRGWRCRWRPSDRHLSISFSRWPCYSS